MPKLLSLREQMEPRSVAEKAFETILLPMMRRHNVSMWIVTTRISQRCRDRFIVPPIRCRAQGFFIFADNGKTLKIRVVRYEEERLKNHYTLISRER